MTADPSASEPWTVTLAWTPDQNLGRVSVMPSRAPVFAIIGLLQAGETHEAIAYDHGLTVEQVRVLAMLADEAKEWA